jgi:hypothetical protein
MPKTNAKVIIPLAVAFWLLAIVIFRDGVPAIIKGVFVAVFVITVPLVVFYLIAETGWSTLAKSYRATVPFKGTWRLNPTVHVSRVSVRDPQYERSKMRFISMLRTGTSEDGLYLSTLLSRVPVLGLFFPTLRIPWSAVTKATTYEAPGWVRPVDDPGKIQIAYDPNYTGTFVEIEAGRPPVYLQLPLQTLGEHAGRLGIPAPAEVRSNDP